MLKIINGDVFDGSCDLLIIPCNTFGGVSKGFQSGILANKLPLDGGPVKYGEVVFVSTDTSKIKNIGFAATVRDRGKTNKEIIEKICLQIIEYARSNNIKDINIPVLGSGAGGLSEKASIDAMDRIFGNTPYRVSVFSVSGLSEDNRGKGWPIEDKGILGNDESNTIQRLRSEVAKLEESVNDLKNRSSEQGEVAIKTINGKRSDFDDHYKKSIIEMDDHKKKITEEMTEKINLIAQSFKNDSLIDEMVVALDGSWNWAIKLSYFFIAHAQGFKPPPLGGAFRLPST